MAADRQHGLLIAVGGNSLIRLGQKGTIAEQLENALSTSGQIAELAGRGYAIVVTHGNGPQVGAQLLRSEAGSTQTYQLPLDVCVAMTQGEIGYILQRSLQSALAARNLHIPVATVVTQVLVDRSDAAFQKPTKPIGPFYSQEAARRKREDLGWAIVEDAARGYRRVVPSPKPRDIVEVDVIARCLDQGMIVIAVGGGGIPVVAENGALRGAEAVIDKDRASALLASELHLERMIISTDVEQVYLGYKTHRQKPLGTISFEDASGHLCAGHFSEGSMKPKIEAALDFLRSGGNEVIITDPEHLVAAVDGKAGTHIVPRGTP